MPNWICLQQTDEETIKWIDEVRKFIMNHQEMPDSTKSLESTQAKSIGYMQRLGELIVEANRSYINAYANALNKLSAMEDETETTRKAKLESWTIEEKSWLRGLQNLKTSLRAVRMNVSQAIKTRREEPYR